MASKNITKELICQESMKLIQEEGIAKLSMRNIASRLGIKAPSLYVHIQNKADLITLLQAYAFKANQLIGSLNPSDDSWQEYLLHIMVNMRNFFLKNPSMFELFAAYESTSDESRQTFEAYLTKMQGYGFSLNDAAYIGRALRFYVIGQVEFEYSNSKIKPTDHHSLQDNLDKNLTHTHNFIVNMGGYSHEKAFQYGANLLINGCKSLLT